MQKSVLKKDVQKLIGKTIYAMKKDGTQVSGKLVRVSGNQLVLAPQKGKQVKTSAIVPLVLFDLLAIGTSPFAFGGYGYGGGFGYPYGGGFYGGFW
ncbi:50S ribosomal protein L33 [Paenibacillus sp. H1-7]|uniref:hypothetical protein n=1 Tax=Paenibacillus sp. H1-7 TaxID=2282849 RepID=UPI001EF81835|nr:hypothetical protein [Paenibacillus sp. H1-7]ULL19003.1 50S ribosomal protein L33 [Paenibacillus sp. H1-7]